jgi:hypothetical protein
LSCALRRNGSVACGQYPAIEPVPSGNDFTAISDGDDNACGFRRGGSIACWGDNTYGQASPPAGSDFTAVSAGADLACAVRSDGSLGCWGDNTYGELKVPAAHWGVGSVSPSSGPAAGGTPITVTGRGFVTGDRVLIAQGHGPGTGAIAATAVHVLSATQITATTPAGQPGTWGVWVINPDGSFDEASTRFSYTPEITSISPTSGPAAGGTQITITGLGLSNGDQVVIGQGEGAGTGAIPATRVDAVSPTEITATTDPGKPGTWHLFVIAPDGSTTQSPETFTYTP